MVPQDPLFSALVSHSIYRREVFYKHAAQLYYQLGPQRRHDPHKLATHWQLLGTAQYSESDLTEHSGGARSACVTSRSSCDASLSWARQPDRCADV